MRIPAVLGAFCLICIAAPGCLIDRIGGAFREEPEDFGTKASLSAQELVARAFERVDSAGLMDFHTHVVAIGTSASGAYVNARMLSGINVERLRFWIYESASGIRNREKADEEYVARLVRLARGIKPSSRYLLLAFDRHYNADGSVNENKTQLYVPNRYVFDLAQRHRDLFVPGVSIHPYRRDALQELETWARAGVKYVKWLPDAMGMDPADPAIEPYYRRMRQHRMVLLSHGGFEQAVEAGEDQRLGNPLRLRKPLDLGLRVIVAHAASLGECDDLDRAGAKARCFDLFLRLMDEPRYVGLVFGEISAMLQFNRMPVPFATVLNRQDLHARMVNGSDYPLPAVNGLVHTRALARDGFITSEERRALNEIYDYNPLLFDFVLKRIARHPATRQRLSASVFTSKPGLE